MPFPRRIPTAAAFFALVLAACGAPPSGDPQLSGSASTDRTALEGQIMVDPENGSHLVYNRDWDGDGELDPFFLIGPGDPEGFLFLGERQADGTRAGGRQLQILDQMRAHGGNGIYFQAVRSGGDGNPDHNPWNDPADPTSGLDADIIRQWRGWFDRMRDDGINLLFFIYDDGTHPFDDGCTGTVSAAEREFIRDLVDAFEDYPNLIWVIQEEFKYVGHTQPRRPCDDARVRKAAQLVDLVKEFDDHGHAVGVHHNVGDAMAFADHPNVDIYVQQADVRPKANRGSLETMRAEGLPPKGFDPQGRYVYLMGEGYNWHPLLLEAKDRTMLRRSYYATAMAGGHVMVLGMYPTEEGDDPTDEMLQDMRRMQRFFESTNFNDLAPHDELGHGGTRWVLADPQGGSYVLYTYDGTGAQGVKGVRAGEYTVRWFDPATGAEVVREKVQLSGDARFERPAEIGTESLLYLRPATTR